VRQITNQMTIKMFKMHPIFISLIYYVFKIYIDFNQQVFGGILYIFIVLWLVIQKFLVIPQQTTGQIKLTARNLKNK
jgi:hypothetical protein